jgi:hypothetical protein
MVEQKVAIFSLTHLVTLVLIVTFLTGREKTRKEWITLKKERETRESSFAVEAIFFCVRFFCHDGLVEYRH